MPPDEFLNPKSMVTPGIAGGVVMLLTNVLAAQFNAPPNWTGLVLSLLVGLLVWLRNPDPLWLRLALYVLNSLIIFAVALGTNQLGVAATRKALTSVLGAAEHKAFFAPWL